MKTPSVTDKLPPDEWWRTPDVHEHIGDWSRSIWYGPEGENGDCATLVEGTPGDYEVSEIQNITDYVDDPVDPPFCVRTVGGVEAQNPQEAVAVGVAYLNYWGGSETFTDSLPV